MASTGCVLSQKILSDAIERDGKPVHDPEEAIFGAKAMIINQSAGSGGDAMPWYFRKANLGTLVGVNTWGAFETECRAVDVPIPPWTAGGLSGSSGRPILGQERSGRLVDL